MYSVHFHNKSIIPGELEMLLLWNSEKILTLRRLRCQNKLSGIWESAPLIAFNLTLFIQLKKIKVELQIKSFLLYLVSVELTSALTRSQWRWKWKLASHSVSHKTSLCGLSKWLDRFTWHLNYTLSSALVKFRPIIKYNDHFVSLLLLSFYPLTIGI